MRFAQWIHALRHDRLRRAAAILAVATVMMLILMLGKPSFTNASRPPLGNAILSLQLASSVEDVDLILSDAPSPDREAMRIKTYLGFVLILCYTALGILLSLLLARRGGWRRAVAIAAGVCTLATGAFDVIASLAILRVLDVPLRETTQAMVNAIRAPGTATWLLGGVAAVLLCAHFVKPSRQA